MLDPVSSSVSGGRRREDYVGSCANREAAARAFSASRADGFSPYASDASAGQKQACLWPG